MELLGPLQSDSNKSDTVMIQQDAIQGYSNIVISLL